MAGNLVKLALWREQGVELQRARFARQRCDFYQVSLSLVYWSVLDFGGDITNVEIKVEKSENVVVAAVVFERVRIFFPHCDQRIDLFIGFGDATTGCLYLQHSVFWCLEAVPDRCPVGNVECSRVVGTARDIRVARLVECACRINDIAKFRSGGWNLSRIVDKVVMKMLSSLW